ncbi:MAG: hypothetical protein COA69_09360 [Robiginitomaculum sp.]|nr:MAG: hypothetical protein COA69_09360 [Robiginitomaculum sp.]
MAQTNLDKAAASQIAVWVDLVYNGVTVRYVSGTQAVLINSEVYTPARGLEATIGKNHGGVADQGAFFQIADSYEPLAAMLKGYIHAPVDVTVGHVDPNSGSGQYERVLFVGKIAKVTRNPSGRQGIAKAELVGTKSLLNITLGYSLTPTCQHRFGDPATCGATPVVVSGTVTAVRVVGNTEVEVAGTFSDLTPALWKRGHVEVAGARAMIRQVSAIAGGAKFVLTRVPPDSWVGLAASVQSGCDKQPSTCEDIYDNINHINPPGATIPAYNPLVATS